MAKKNYNYGKIEDGKLVYAPNPIRTQIVDENGNLVTVDAFSASEEVYNSNGWKRIESTDYPNDGKAYVPLYEELDNRILLTWEETDVPPMLEEQVEAIAEAVTELAELIGGML